MIRSTSFIAQLLLVFLFLTGRTTVAFVQPNHHQVRSTALSERHISTYKVWRERADPAKHRDYMSVHGVGGAALRQYASRSKHWMYFLQSPNEKFVFSFHGLEQVEECKVYFKRKVQGSTKLVVLFEHEYHMWYSRLPKGLTTKNNRKKILKLLDKITDQWGDDRL